MVDGENVCADDHRADDEFEATLAPRSDEYSGVLPRYLLDFEGRIFTESISADLSMVSRLDLIGATDKHLPSFTMPVNTSILPRVRFR